MTKLARSIESRPDVMGGDPCIEGTRVPVATIQSCHANGWSEARIAKEYSFLNATQISDALQFVSDHKPL